jgi:hypothetical protein
MGFTKKLKSILSFLMIVSTEPTMPIIISTNEDRLDYQTGDQFYNRLYRSTIESYVVNMLELIQIDIEEDGDYSDENPYDWRDYSRQYEVNNISKTEYDFLSAIGEDSPAIRAVRIIMKMEEVVKEHHEQNGFDFDMSLVGDIGKLYAMWIYVITDEVDFEIDYDEDGYESGDEVILLRPQQ